MSRRKKKAACCKVISSDEKEREETVKKKGNIFCFKVWKVTPYISRMKNFSLEFKRYIYITFLDVQRVECL